MFEKCFLSDVRCYDAFVLPVSAKKSRFLINGRLLIRLANFIAINCNKLVNQIGAVQTENVDFSLIVCYNQIQ